MVTNTKDSQGRHSLPEVRKILKELQAGLKSLYGKNTPVLLVYGSYARAEAHPESDIDVLLIYPYDVRPAEEIQRVSAILADLNLHYQALISVLPASQNKYQYSQETFWKNVRREGIPSEII
jgi:uncharacterized protein